MKTKLDTSFGTQMQPESGNCQLMVFTMQTLSEGLTTNRRLDSIVIRRTMMVYKNSVTAV